MPKGFPIRKNFALQHGQAGRCLGCGIILLLLLVITLLLGYLFRREIEAWVYIKILEGIESKIEQKKLPATDELKDLQQTFKKLKAELKRNKVERSKFWQAIRQLQKILLKENLNTEDLKKIERILKEIPVRVKKELATV